MQFVRALKLPPEAGERRLGLSKSVLRNWLSLGVRRKPREREPQLQRVEVVASESRVSEHELRIVFPVGAHVVLSLGQLQQLLGGEP